MKNANYLYFFSAWVGSLAYGMLYFIGPVSAFLCTKVGCPTTAIVGGLLFGSGLLCSSLVDNLYQMLLTYSLLTGAGCSLCYFSSVLVLTKHFCKNLVLANGLGLSGTGVGTIALAPFVNFLRFHFRWRATVKILSAFSAVLVLSGFLYWLVPSPTRRVMIMKETEKKSIEFSVLKNKAYIVWVTAVGLALFGFYIPFVHLVSQM